MSLCPHCNNTHINGIEQALCPLRPEQVPIMIRDFGPLATDSQYRVTDYISYMLEGRQYNGVILWIVGPGNTGESITPDNQVRYVVDRHDSNVAFGFSEIPD